MNTKLLFIFTLSLIFAVSASAQQPPRTQKQGPPNGRGGESRDRPDGKGGDWIRPHDADQNGILDAEEFKAAVERTFAELDRNGNGILEVQELRQAPQPPQGPRPERGFGDQPPPPQRGEQRPGNGKRILPPFFFMDRIDRDKAMTRAEFETVIRSTYAGMDKNSDGSISAEEADKLPRADRPDNDRNRQPPPPNAQFIGAELRFGDKPVKGHPFSAETVIEDTKLLFDGTTVKNTRTGAIYRDGNGRVRREQPFEMIGGISIVGSGNKPQKLVFIHDFAAKTQMFLDENRKVAKKTRMPENQPRPTDLEDRPGATTVSDGTKTIEGVTCDLTRTEHEIPAGQIGNEKPLKVVSEKCFSPELQVVIMSLHQDPVGGLHVFKLKNIKKAEPAEELFAVPSGYRVEN